MQKQSKPHLLGRVQSGLRGLCGGSSHIGQAVESSTGSASVPADAPGQAGQGGDIGGSESGGVKL